MFSLNPTNLGLVVATAIDLLGASISQRERLLFDIGFVLAAALPVLLPSLFLIVRGAKAEPGLLRLRRWVVRNNGFLSAGLLVLVGVLQLAHALDGVLA